MMTQRIRTTIFRDIIIIVRRRRRRRRRRYPTIVASPVIKTMMTG